MAESNEDLISYIDALQKKFPGIIKEYEYMVLTQNIKARFIPD